MLKLLSILCIVLPISVANANNVTGTMNSSASITATCAISTDNLSFGTYNPNSGNAFATGNITFTCTKGISLKVGINTAGTGDGAVVDTTYSVPYTDGTGSSQSWSRYMSNGSNVLYYNIFQDANHTQIFAGTNWYANDASAQESLVATGSTQTVPFYGAMEGGQYVAPGTYSDTAVAFISY